MPNPNPHLALADAAEARANAATKAPWIKHEGEAISRRVQPRVKSTSQPGAYLPICNGVEYDNPGANRYNQDMNLTFIAHARQDVPALSAAVREQAATTTALQAKLFEALALVEAGYREGGLKGAAYARGEHGHNMDEAWANSNTRAAVERLRLEGK